MRSRSEWIPSERTPTEPETTATPSLKTVSRIVAPSASRAARVLRLLVVIDDSTGHVALAMIDVEAELDGVANMFRVLEERADHDLRERFVIPVRERETERNAKVRLDLRAARRERLVDIRSARQLESPGR